MKMDTPKSHVFYPSAIVYVFFLADLDTNGKMTSFLFYPYLRRDGNGVSEVFFSSKFIKEFVMMMMIP